MVFIILELFTDLIRNINDPEHPLSLEELHVLEQSRVTVNDDKGEVFVQFTPTIPVSFKFNKSNRILINFHFSALFDGNTHWSQHQS